MLLKTTRTVLIIALVSAFCRLRFLQQMMLTCRYTLQLNSNRANYHFTLLATNFDYVSFARISDNSCDHGDTCTYVFYFARR